MNKKVEYLPSFRVRLNVGQALLSLVWGSWFAIIGINVLDADKVKDFWKVSWISNPLFVVRAIYSLSLFISIICMAIFILYVQEQQKDQLNNEFPEDRNNKRNLKNVSKQIIIYFFVFFFAIGMPLFAYISLEGINPFHMIVSGSLVLGFMLFVRLEELIIRKRRSQLHESK